MRLVEKKNLAPGVTPDIGAARNKIGARGQNGAIFGFGLSNLNGVVKVAKGLLSVQGFTFEVLETEDLFDISSFAVASTETYIIYLAVTFDAATRDVSSAVECYKASVLKSNVAIEQGISGTFYYPLAKFVKSGSAIASFQSLVKDISNSGTGNSVVVPQPTLAIVNIQATHSGVKSVLNGWVMIGNVLEYASLASSYDVQFVFFRKLQKSHTRSAKKLWTTRTMWCESEMSGSSGIGNFSKLTVGYNNLVSISISGSTYPTKKSICPVSDIIQAAFYVKASDGTKTAVTQGCNPAQIRSTRSHNAGKTRGIRHNFVEFAYKARVYSNGVLIGESAMSNPVVIVPNVKAKQGGVLGTYFTIKCL